jgi:hypothetical protein
LQIRSEAFWDWWNAEAGPRLGDAACGDFMRTATYRRMFQYLDDFEHAVVIVETGCIESADNWAGNGSSTLQWNKYVETHPGSIALSADNDFEKVQRARALCPHVCIICNDSIAQLTMWNDEFRRKGLTIDLLYLDSGSMDQDDQQRCQLHHLNELRAISPSIRDDTLIAVDDSPTVDKKIQGRAGMVALHAGAMGAKMAFAAYQVGFIGLAPK